MTEPKPEQPRDETLLAWELKKKVAERQHDYADKLQLALLKAAVANGSGVVRNLVLINGVAAISVMTFVGSLAARFGVSHEQISTIAAGLKWFAGGVLTLTEWRLVAGFTPAGRIGTTFQTR